MAVNTLKKARAAVDSNVLIVLPFISCIHLDRLYLWKELIKSTFKKVWTSKLIKKNLGRAWKKAKHYTFYFLLTDTYFRAIHTLHQHAHVV